ncbi:FitA-like ribbon-helix-helix domain-containing protein [Floridanema aerugineum]|uniref:Antitoxin FitA-like ribbon-helix-helix domain-containing protein n=1 Tax=Floridaenema aerugineum BLCC-F46 TaxID=3153654 RepID=A0ABV4X341_9CYAN
MAQVIIEDLDSEVIEKLQMLAQRNGRSLQAELKHILETAASSTLSKEEIILKKAEKMRQQIAYHAGQDISELPPIDREKALQKLAELKEIKKISSTGMSIREMREEGRRF